MEQLMLAGREGWANAGLIIWLEAFASKQRGAQREGAFCEPFMEKGRESHVVRATDVASGEHIRIATVKN
jgi:hypothetical protein